MGVDVITAVRESARKISEPETNEHLARIAVIEEQIGHHERLLSGMLKIEEMAKEKMRSVITDLKKQEDKLKNFLKYKDRYHLLSLEPLRWRDKKGLPRLVVFSLEDPNFSIVAIDDYENNRGFRKRSYAFIPNEHQGCEWFPAVAEIYYGDVVRLLWEKGKGAFEIKVSCKFNGIIPASIKEEIKKVKEIDPSLSLALIAEPEKIEINKINPSSADPLLVGFDGHSLWLIDSFDTTSVEEAMFFYRPPKF